MKKGYILTLFLVLTLTPLLQGLPDAEQITSSGGLTIQYPPDNVFTLGSSYNFTFKVFNLTTGMPINSSISCYFDYFNGSGSKTASLGLGNPSYYDYSFFVNSNNFSYLDESYYNIFCNSSTIGSLPVSVPLKVTTTGRSLELSVSLIYLLLTLSIFSLFIISLLLTLKVPYENDHNEAGQTIKINKKKYIKLFLIGLDYALLVWSLSLLIAVSNSYSQIAIYYAYVTALFQFLLALLTPFMIILTMVIAYNIIRDFKEAKIIKSLGVMY